MSTAILLATQNSDGGWPYARGSSWTEPTVYAVLALLEAGETAAARRGLDWLQAAQRPDGGWPPRPGVDQTTWVTALVALIAPEHLAPGTHRSAIRWLLGATGRESTSVYRLREWLLGNAVPADQRFPGWPWVPGTAAWVSPTSVAILALAKEEQRLPSADVRRRIREGQGFLVARMCTGGGWNHGSAHALGYASLPYPETTGMALAALRGFDAPEVRMGIGVARRFLADCRSADALNWLRLGLAAHGQLPPGFCPPPDVPRRTIPETSLNLLVSAADGGRRLFEAAA